jgi:hypothetical protein
MKKVFIAAVLLSVSTVIFAQNGGERSGRGRFDAAEVAKRQTEWMKKELSLNGKQIKSVDSINVVFAKKQQALFQNRERNENLSDSERQAARENRMKQMQELNARKETALAEVLTAEQLEIYRKKSGEMFRQNGRSNHDGSGVAGGQREGDRQHRIRPSRKAVQ